MTDHDPLNTFNAAQILQRCCKTSMHTMSGLRKGMLPHEGPPSYAINPKEVRGPVPDWLHPETSEQGAPVLAHGGVSFQEEW